MGWGGRCRVGGGVSGRRERGVPECRTTLDAIMPTPRALLSGARTRSGRHEHERELPLLTLLPPRLHQPQRGEERHRRVQVVHAEHRVQKREIAVLRKRVVRVRGEVAADALARGRHDPGRSRGVGGEETAMCERRRCESARGGHVRSVVTGAGRIGARRSPSSMTRHRRSRGSSALQCKFYVRLNTRARAVPATVVRAPHAEHANRDTRASASYSLRTHAPAPVRALRLVLRVEQRTSTRDPRRVNRRSHASTRSSSPKKLLVAT